MSARAYLIDRFRGDTETLRDRAASLGNGTTLPGPDLVTSQQMADACSSVVSLLETLPASPDADREVTELLTLIPSLEARARTVAHPPVRAVYVGAVTRIREVHAAHTRNTDAP